MVIDWIKEDGTFTDDWRDKALPQELRGEASLADVKGLSGLAKAFVDTKKAVGQMVKLPDTTEGKREVLNKHFKDVLDADAVAAKKKQDSDAAAAQAQAETAAAEARTQRQAAVKTLLGGPEGKEFDVNLELARRAVRSGQMPQVVKNAFAATVGKEWGKVSDDEIRAVLSEDPAIAALVSSYGKLLKDGKLETDDGQHHETVDEKEPLQPNSPELYIGLPSGDPVRRWWENHGWDMSGKVPHKKKE